MLNNVTLVGRLVRDAELRYAKSGTAVCKFTLAVDRKFNREQTDFIDCVCWKGLAENVANYTGKGSLVAVQGSIVTGSYEGRGGQKRKTFEINCDQVVFLDRKKDGQSKPKDQWDELGTEIELTDSTEGSDDIPF
jgi:single-strand DNA-binding protein